MPRLIDQILSGQTPKPKKAKPDTNLQSVNPPDEEVMPIVPDDLPEALPATKATSSVRLIPTKYPEMGKPPKILFIKCLPSKDYSKRFGEPKHYSDIIKDYAADICEAYDVPHLSMAGSYGDGYKQLAAKVAQNGWGDTSCIYINPMRSKGCDHVLDVLVALADIVVEGT